MCTSLDRLLEVAGECAWLYGTCQDRRFYQGCLTSGESVFFRLMYESQASSMGPRNKECVKVMKQMKVPHLAMVLGMGLFMVACGGEGGGEGPIVAPPQAPAEWADKHMPAGWWADAAKL